MIPTSCETVDINLWFQPHKLYMMDDGNVGMNKWVVIWKVDFVAFFK